LALQEILLAGCPTVGVRTGASFVRNGVTGFVVDRLPPGRQCVENDADQLALALYVDAIARAQALDRQSIRAAAEQEFSQDAIVEEMITALEQLRTARV
jgi:glycosyltransferase involved in cell wall biosynthesis